MLYIALEQVRLHDDALDREKEYEMYASMSK